MNAGEHYGSASLVAIVQASLAAAGLGAGPVAWEAIASLDQFHVGGAAATRDLADRLAIDSKANVLDVGCGLGGPARQLAAAYGCDVTGIDISATFVELAAYLTGRSGLADKARFLVADATDVPFAREGFDVVVSQHVAMNIADREGLYREIYRLLVRGGRFATYDVVAGDGSPIHFPVPWASDPAASFVVTAESTRRALERSGFEVVAWRDATVDAMAWQQAQAVASQSRPDPSKRLGLPLIMGPQFADMAANLGRNLREGRVRLLQAIVRRRD